MNRAPSKLESNRFFVLAPFGTVPPTDIHQYPPLCSRVQNPAAQTLVLGQVFKVGVEDAEKDGDDDDEAASTAGGYGRGRGGAGGRTIRSKSVGMEYKKSLADLVHANLEHLAQHQRFRGRILNT